MSHKEIIKRVTADFDNRRIADEEGYDRIISELNEKIPEYGEVSRKLSSIGFRLFSASVNHSKEEAVTAVDEIHRDSDLLREEKAKILLANGYPADYDKRKYRCELCSDSGFIGLNMCKCLRSEIISAEIEASGIGKLIRTQSFDNFNLSYYPDDVSKRISFNMSVLRSFAENFNRDSDDSFLLIGPTGLGKTHLSTSVARIVIERGYSVTYKTAQSVMTVFEKQRFGDGFNGDGTERELYDADLLIIDDLGTEVTTQYTVAWLYELINTRMNEEKSTIINTNLTKDELRSRYADRITSRLFGEYKPLLFSGNDIRQQKLMKK